MIKQFFFMVCLILVTGSMLLIWDSPPESFLRPEANIVNRLPSADTYMTNIETFIFSSDGSKKYSLKASEMSVFSEAFNEYFFDPSDENINVSILVI